MMGLLRILTQPCPHHGQTLTRGGSIAYHIKRKITALQAILSESPVAYVTKASELQTWVTRHRSALPHVGAELEKTQDGPSAEELEVWCPPQGPCTTVRDAKACNTSQHHKIGV